MPDEARPPQRVGETSEARAWRRWYQLRSEHPFDGKRRIDERLSRSDYPGDDAGWRQLVALDERALGYRRRASASGGPPRAEPPPPRPERRIASRLPREFAEVRLDDLVADDRVLRQDHLLTVARRWVASHRDGGEPAGISIRGPVGTGKSLVLAAIANDIDAQRGYWSTRQLKEQIHLQLEDEGLGFFKGSLMRAPVLLVDDVGAGRGTDRFLADTLATVFETRHANGLTTHLTTNLAPEELADYLTARVASRLRALNYEVVLEGPDLRESPLP